MLDDTCRQKRVRRDLHRFRVAPVLQRVLGKQCGENLRAIQLAERRQSLYRRVARQPARLLDCHLEAIGCRLQAVRLLINQIAESLGRFCELPRCCLALEFRFDLRTHVDQRTLRANLDARHLDDVVAEFRLYQPGHLILLGLEDGIFKRLDHHAAAKKTKIAPFLRRARILGVLLRQFGKSARRLLDLLQHFFRFRPRLLSIHVRVGQDQNVARAPFLGLLVAILVAFIPTRHFRIADLGFLKQTIERQYNELGLCLLGNFKAVRIVVIELPHGGRIDLHPLEKLIGSKSQLRNLSLLGLYAQHRVGRGRAGDARITNRRHQLLEREILTNLCLELRLRHALRGQHRPVASQRELSVLLQGRDLADHFTQ